MKILGCDLHAKQQTIAMVDTETGEFTEKTLSHEGNEVREFYAALEGPVVVGIEATGAMQCGTEGLPKRPTKRGPEGLPLCGSHKQLKVRVCWTGRLPACRSSRPGSEAGSNQQVWRARQENTTQMAGDCCPAHESLACV